MLFVAQRDGSLTRQPSLSPVLRRCSSMCLDCGLETAGRMTTLFGHSVTESHKKENVNFELLFNSVLFQRDKSSLELKKK